MYTNWIKPDALFIVGGSFVRDAFENQKAWGRKENMKCHVF
jgi:hypothetical protein